MTDLATKTCDIFKADEFGYDGIAIFVMCGLTAFRPQSYDYIRDLGRMSFAADPFEVYDVEVREGCRLRRLLYARNRDNKIYSEDELKDMFGSAMTLLEDASCSNVASNAIRTYGDSELDTYRAAHEWIQEHEKSRIEHITLIDHKGEFKNALDKLML